ncbi:MAG: imidazolonepropionase [bacterium]|nr:imidazolonepropionase [bacterium]
MATIDRVVSGNDAALAAGPDLLVENIGQLCTLDAPGRPIAGPRRGADLDDAGVVARAALAVTGGRVLAYGPQEELRARSGAPKSVLDAGGRCVVPGWVDPHTHAVFGRTRQDEYERRLRGETYLQIAAAGGGIQSSVRDLRERSDADLRDLAVTRLREILELGTTTIEIKSGYGLSYHDESRTLRIAAEAAQAVGLRVVRTCLAAHEVPPEYRDRRGDYVRLICDEILPRIVGEGLAERLDVFCEPTVFDLEQTATILRRGQQLGLRATVHADELASFGGAALAARLGADSADHLIRIDAAGIAALAGSPTVAVLLPGTVFSLGLRDYAPARSMIEAGVAVALATDFNPGSCPIASVPLIQAIACTQMRLSPAEALAACTVNAAWALGLQDEVGSLAPGHAADFLVLDVDDHRLVPYHAGRNPVREVWRDGRRVVAR